MLKFIGNESADKQWEKIAVLFANAIDAKAKSGNESIWITIPTKLHISDNKSFKNQ